MLFSVVLLPFFYFFFSNDTATTEIYTLSLHDALPISRAPESVWNHLARTDRLGPGSYIIDGDAGTNFEEGRADLEYLRSEEHTSELQSPMYLVCRLLLEKKKKKKEKYKEEADLSRPLR